MQNNEERTVKLRADMIRKKMLAANAEGTALREVLSRLSDQELIKIQDRETAAEIAQISEQRRKRDNANRLSKLFKRCCP
jgi:hypothetical protein